MRTILLISVFVALFNPTSYSQNLDNLIKKAEDTYNESKSKINESIDKYTAKEKQTLSNEDIIQGLKEALSVGTQSAVSISSKVDGYLKNPRLFIPFPPEAQEMKDKLIKYGFSKKINEFEILLNRAAENAAKDATPIFMNAIKQMTISDGMQILRGTDTSATQYLRQTTYDFLYNKFLPVVKKSIQEVKLTNYWKPLVSAYNKLPNKKKYNPDLEKYVTEKAIKGLFILIADEEKKH